METVVAKIDDVDKRVAELEERAIVPMEEDMNSLKTPTKSRKQLDQEVETPSRSNTTPVRSQVHIYMP